jgi:hypothetical protein
MLYHFDIEPVKRLLEHARASDKHQVLYDNPDTDAPGLWIVGDQGLYILSNGDPRFLRAADDPEREHSIVFAVYADEANPWTLPFDQWWEAKRQGFGGDDGVEFLPVIEIDRQLRNPLRADKFVLDITPERIGVPYRAVKGARRPKRPLA